jgi:predicted membrane channel-forming protein YqfA (hemolysin III family)
MHKKFRQPVSDFTHAAGSLLSIIILIVMVIVDLRHKTAWDIVANSIFGSSLIMLYTASAVYLFMGWLSLIMIYPLSQTAAGNPYLAADRRTVLHGGSHILRAEMAQPFSGNIGFSRNMAPADVGRKPAMDGRRE